MFILLLLLWIIYNGQLTLEIFILGLIAVGAVYAFMCKFVGFSIKKDLAYMSCIPLIILYILLLIKEIIKANLSMIPYMLTGKEKTDPVIISFDSDLKTRAAKVILADSITLTPGTITIDIEENHFIIHCLDRKLGEGLATCEFAKLIEKIEKKALSVAADKKEGV